MSRDGFARINGYMVIGSVGYNVKTQVGGGFKYFVFVNLYLGGNDPI